ncbi:hypothetical protein [Kiloniella litopenaei]|uniref:hypothetical protein n=1 Tax=Kiloniella litopenaei TaxID=1549748 RepID=UPI003BAD6D45
MISSLRKWLLSTVLWCGLVVWIVWQYQAPMVMQVENNFSEAVEPAPTQSTDIQIYETVKPKYVLTRPLFIETRQRPQLEKVIEKEVKPRKRPDLPKGQVVGFVSVPTGTFVLYENEDDVLSRLGVGEVIGDWKIESFEDKKVSLTAQGFTHELKLIEKPLSVVRKNNEGVSFVGDEQESSGKTEEEINFPSSSVSEDEKP